MVTRINMSRLSDLPGLSLEGTIALVRALQTRHGAHVVGHDVESDGTIIFDLRLDARSMRGMRSEYRSALARQNLAHVEACRVWMQQVRDRLALRKPAA